MIPIEDDSDRDENGDLVDRGNEPAAHNAKSGIRRIKTQNFGSKKANKDDKAPSTALNASLTKNENLEMQSVITMDEKLGGKKKKRGKTTTSVNAGPVVSKPGPVDPNDRYMVFKNLMRHGENEFMEETMGKDPYEMINKKTHKIEINPVMPYRSTSMEEVFEIRNAINEAKAVQEFNRYIKAKMPESLNIDEEMEEVLEDYIKPQFDAY